MCEWIRAWSEGTKVYVLMSVLFMGLCVLGFMFAYVYVHGV